MSSKIENTLKTTMLSLSLLTASATACSAMPRQGVQHAAKADADQRGAAPVHQRRARALVSGPAIIRHIETDGRGVVALYLMDDPGIGDGKCPKAAAEGSAPIAVLNGSSRVADLQVPEGKRICASVESGGTMRVAWHASPASSQPGNHYDVALLAR
jgi:hypothetical protein